MRAARRRARVVVVVVACLGPFSSSPPPIRRVVGSRALFVGLSRPRNGAARSFARARHSWDTQLSFSGGVSIRGPYQPLVLFKTKLGPEPPPRRFALTLTASERDLARSEWLRTRLLAAVNRSIDDVVGVLGLPSEMRALAHEAAGALRPRALAVRDAAVLSSGEVVLRVALALPSAPESGLGARLGGLVGLSGPLLAPWATWAPGAETVVEFDAVARPRVKPLSHGQVVLLGPLELARAGGAAAGAKRHRLPHDPALEFDLGRGLQIKGFHVELFGGGDASARLAVEGEVIVPWCDARAEQCPVEMPADPFVSDAGAATRESAGPRVDPARLLTERIRRRRGERASSRRVAAAAAARAHPLAVRRDFGAREVVMRLLSTTCRFLRDAIGGFARAMPGRSKAVSVADERA